MIAPCPANTLAPAWPAIAARVIPPARLTASAGPNSGFTAGATSSAALNGSPNAEIIASLDRGRTSLRPRSVIPTTSPGVTHLPAASITSMRRGRSLPRRGDHPAAAHHDRAALDRRAAVTDHHVALTTAKSCAWPARPARPMSNGANGSRGFHLVSPMPGWPSSKSLTGGAWDRSRRTSPRRRSPPSWERE